MAIRSWISLALRAWRLRRRGDPELRWLPRLVGHGRRAIDIGANRGVYTYWLSRCCRHVEAFEPNPDLARILDGTSLRGVCVHSLALGDGAGTASLFVPFHRRAGREFDDPAGRIQTDDGAEDEGGVSHEITVKRLDDFSFDDVDFIKIDVEGHEEKVLDGGFETIVANRPALLVELEERHSPGCVARVAARFKSIDYRVGFLDHGRWYDLAALGHGQKGPSGRYINNFLMMPGARAGEFFLRGDTTG